mmetsp:Transcript_4672/g.17033  ORF Transcript_4672/g.17033 Transcript_4672/m.17033 type:complete len:219 (+) Transcript_4672:1036-1692(+)
MSAHSRESPWIKLVTMAISPHVMSAPSRLHTRLYGKFPTVVNGARYNLFLKSMTFFSTGRMFVNAPTSVTSSSSAAALARLAALSSSPSPDFVSTRVGALVPFSRTSFGCCTNFAIAFARVKSYIFLRNFVCISRGSALISLSTLVGFDNVSTFVNALELAPPSCVDAYLHRTPYGHPDSSALNMHSPGKSLGFVRIHASMSCAYLHASPYLHVPVAT